MRSVNAFLLGAMLASPALRGAVTFEPNRGQAPRAASYLARTPSGPVVIAAGRLRFSGKPQDVITFANAHGSRGEGMGLLPGVSHYADRGAWDVPHYSGVRFRRIYRGIDLVYHDAQGHVEFDFEVGANANPREIELVLRNEVSLDMNGTLRSGDIVLHKPFAWQDVDGRRVPVDVAFERRGQKRATFRLGEYRRDLPLTIDPILQFATYWGGSKEESSTRMLLAGDGAILLGGNTRSEDFPAALPDEYGLNRPPILLRPAAYVTRFTSGGTTVDWSLFLGFNQQLVDFKQDSLGNVYVLGSTTSARVAGTESAFRKRLPLAGTDWFVTKLDARTGRIKASTYLGVTTNSNNGTPVGQMAIDPTGGVYVMGVNATLLYPTTAGALQSAATSPFVIRLNATLTGLVYATYTGISTTFRVSPVMDVDASGNVWIAGQWGGAFPFSSVNPIPGINQMPQGVQQGFLMKLNSTGTARLFSSYIHAGGGSESAVNAIKVAPSGDVYVTGTATGTAFPVVNPMQIPADTAQTYDYSAYPYVMKLAPEGTQIRSATYFKGLLGANTGSIVLRPNGLPCYAGSENNVTFKQTPGGLGTVGTRYGPEMTISCVDDLEREFTVKTRVPVQGAFSDIAAPSNDTILFAGLSSFTPLPETLTTGMIQPKPAGGPDAIFLRISLVNPEPKISSVLPASVLINSTSFTSALRVTISGTGFGDAMDVTFNGKAVTSSFDSSESVSLPSVDYSAVRPGANAVNVTLPGPGGGMSSGTLMGINASPTSISVSPVSVQVGAGETRAVIRATNLTPDSVLRWGGQVRSANYVPDTPRGGHFELILSPDELSQSKTVEVTVTVPAPGGGTSPIALFRVLPASTTAIPAIGVGGITLVIGNAPVIPFAITAQNVASGAKVTWDGQEVPTTFVSPTRLDISPSPDKVGFGVHRAYVTSGGVQSATIVFPSGIAFSNNLTGVGSPAGDRLYIVGRSSFNVPISEAPELLTLDTATGALLMRLPIKLMKNVSGPAKLAISSDGKYVYVASSSEGLIQRYNTETQSFDLEWVPYVSPTEGSRTGIAGLATIFDHPESVLVAYFTAEGTNLAIFDNDHKRASEWVNFNSDFGVPFVAEDRAVLYLGYGTSPFFGCWASLRIEDSGVSPQSYACQQEPEGTRSEGTIRYLPFAGRNLLVSTPLSSSSTGPFAILDLARRRAIQFVNNTQIWEYNIDSGEQRFRATTSNPTLLVNREDGGTLVLSSSSVFPVP